MNYNAEFNEKNTQFDAIVEALRSAVSKNDSYPDHNGKYWALCPFHDDERVGSFSFNSEDFHCFACGASGSIFELARKLGISEYTNNSSKTFAGITLGQYASLKKLPLDYLLSLQITERKKSGIPQLLIPYFERTGQKTGTRVRLSIAGPNRFLWQQGSRLIPYGLWMLDGLLHDCIKIGDQGNYIILVQGESDAQTLWFYGIPALGLSGATIWKPEWKEFFTGKEIFVWQEPGEAGERFVQGIGKDMPEIRIIHPPQNRKDISECHIEGDNVVEVIDQLMESSILLLKIQDMKIAEETERISVLAEPILRSNVLEEVVNQCKKFGIVGEEKEIKLLYLALTSRLLGRPISIAIKGPSSSGKSYLLETVLKLFPETAFYKISSMSEKALYYSKESFVHRFLIILEAEGLSSDFISYVIRALLSEDHIRHVTVEKTDTGMHELVLDKEGPTGFITTTTLINLHPENETRLMSLTVTDDPVQTKKIMLKIAESSMGKSDFVELPQSFIAFQLWLEKIGKTKVVIPYASDLAKLTVPAAVRIRRDFKVVINLITIVAILYQQQRDLDENDQIVATLEDYRIVYDLVSELINEGAESSVKPNIRQTVEAVAKLLQSEVNDLFDINSKSVDNAILAKELGLDPSSTSRRIKSAIAAGFLEYLEPPRKGLRVKIILGRKMPEDRSILPTPEELENRWCDLPELPATVQHSQNISGDQYEQLS